jgi:acyl-CoA reductase-like NAD-dependent aldehyde dehydrogenase
MYSEIEKCSWKVAFGGEKPDESSKGYYITPTIIDNPPDDSRIVVEEPFGPIIPMLKWSTEEEVLERANSGETGLGASVWSKGKQYIFMCIYPNFIPMFLSTIYFQIKFIFACELYPERMFESI